MGMDADETKRNTPAVTAPQKTESGKGHTASIYSLIKKRDEATPTEPEENKKVFVVRDHGILIKSDLALRSLKPC